MFDNKVLEVAYKPDINTSNMFKQLLEERFVRVSNELIEKMWAKIDTRELGSLHPSSFFKGNLYLNWKNN